MWLEEGWNQGFGLSDDPDLRGVGWTAEEVGAWTPPGKEIQLGYYEAVKASRRMILVKWGRLWEGTLGRGKDDNTQEESLRNPWGRSLLRRGK